MTQNAVVPEIPFLKGYPNARQPNELLSLVEAFMAERAQTLGICKVALGDAELPVVGAMRRDILLPVLVDYANKVILQQTDLRFDSALADELTTGAAVDAATEEQRPPTEDDLIAADKAATAFISQGLLINNDDPKAGLNIRTHTQPAASMPLSVNLLLLDTALESSVHLSQKHQQATLGTVETDTLDLSPTYNLLQRLNLPVPGLPTALHQRLAALLKQEPQTTKPSNPTPDNAPEDETLEASQ